MKAVVFDPQKEDFDITQVPIPQLQEGEALIRIKAAALNHRDQWIREGKYPGITKNIFGSDGYGVVEKVHNKKEQSWVGEPVIIYPSVNWGPDTQVQSSDFEVLGIPTDGTFAEYIKMPVEHLYSAPSHLSETEAAALPLGGLTAYRAVAYKARIKEQEKVIVTGAGGGVAHFAIQFAHTLGAKVYATSSEAKKIDHAKELGAIAGVNYTSSDWKQKFKKQFGAVDAIIDSACGDQMNQLIDLLRPGGRLIFYGATLGKPSRLHVHKIFFKQLTLRGTTMGSPQDFKNMLALVRKHQLTPTIDSIRPIDEIADAFQKMKAGNQQGKLVVTL